MDNPDLKMLPLEVRQNIAALLDGPDLRNLRLVCRACEEGSRKSFAETFFSHITVFLAHVSLERLIAICANPRIGPHVKRIDLASRRLCKRGMDWITQLREAERRRLWIVHNRHLGDEDSAYEAVLMYLVAFAEQRNMDESGKASHMLAEALREHSKHDKPLVLGLCDLPWRLSLIDSPWYFHRLGDGLGSKKFFGNICAMDPSLYSFQWQTWRTWALDLLITTSREHKKITGFVIDLQREREKEVKDEDPHKSALCMSASRLTTICHNLRSLKFRIHPGQSRTSSETLRSILSCADQIQELSLNLSVSPRYKPRATSRGLLNDRFLELAKSCPATCKLASLTLKNVWACESDITTFLQKHRESLAMLNIKALLLDGSWKDMLEWMKHNLPILEKLRLQELYVYDSTNKRPCRKVYSGNACYSSVDQAIMNLAIGLCEYNSDYAETTDLELSSYWDSDRDDFNRSSDEEMAEDDREDRRHRKARQRIM